MIPIDCGETIEGRKKKENLKEALKVLFGLGETNNKI